MWIYSVRDKYTSLQCMTRASVVYNINIYLIHYRSICVFISYTIDPHMYLSHTL